MTIELAENELFFLYIFVVISIGIHFKTVECDVDIFYVISKYAPQVVDYLI